MASLETYDGTMRTAVNAVVATTVGLDGSAHGTHGHGHAHGSQSAGPGTVGEDDVVGAAGPTGGNRATMAGSGVEGTIISGHEDRFVRFFDANSGRHHLAPSSSHARTISPMHVHMLESLAN